MKRSIALILLFIVFSSTQSSAIQNSLPRGAGLLINVQTDDLDRYISELTKNALILRQENVVAGGYCIVKTGNNYSGEVSVWQYFTSMSDLMRTVDNSDPVNNADLNFEKMRDVKYISIWKDMKEVNIKPGFEMVEKWKVPGEKLEEFVKAVTSLESSLKDLSGVEFEMTAAFNVGSGVKETDLVMTRWITPNGETMGKLLDLVYNSVGYLPEYNNLISLAEKVNSQLEECTAVYD